jgi:hypothetical protein
VEVLLVLDLVARQLRRADDERRSPIELRRGLGPRGLLKPLERLGSENAKPPRVGQVVVGRPAGELEQLVEDLARDGARLVGLVGAPRADRVVNVHCVET